MDHSVRSPCIGNCQLDDNEHCRGCFRTIDEIISWSALSNSQKQQIIQRVSPLKSAVKKIAQSGY